MSVNISDSDAELFQRTLGTVPSRVVAPESVEEATQVVTDCAARGETIAPWGGGGAQTFGYLPMRAVDVVISMRRLNRIIGVEAGDLTISVQGGATLARVQHALGEAGLFLPLDAEDASVATIGGILATNAHGVARTGYGTARDWLIGLTTIDAQGNIVKGGGNVVKNVTGYDLPKLHTGALGTLGIIVSANFKVAPLPEASESLIFALPQDALETTAFLARVRDATAPVIALIRTRNKASLLLLSFAGFREAVADDGQKATSFARETSMGAPALATVEAVAHLLVPPTPLQGPLRIRVSTGLATETMSLHDAIAAALPDALEIRALPFVGIVDVFAKPDADPLAFYSTVADVADAQNATLTVPHAPLSLRTGEVELWRPLPASFALMRRLKETLDPENRLNGGRFIGRL